MDGIIPLWKEKGMTSHDCVFKMRKILQTKKVGHGGTLDPSVEGVLPICVGRATKLVEKLHELPKTYMGEITLGVATETEDADGEVVEKKEVTTPLSTEEIDAAMASFVGTMIQIPPMYSAVKVKGKRLYEYARNHEEVERPQREVTIYEFKRASAPDYDEKTKTQRWRFVVTCSKGTYIRTLSVDLGEKLGYPAHMSQLVRLASGGFQAKDAVKLSEVEAAVKQERLSDCLFSISEVMKDQPRRDLSQFEYHIVKNGGKIEKLPSEKEWHEIAFYYQDELVALYHDRGGKPTWFCDIMIQIGGK